MKEHLDFVLKGGNAKELEKKMVDGMFGTGGGNTSANFKTPHVDNVFEVYSEFQAASAAVKSFNHDGGDSERINLRNSIFAQENFALASSGSNTFRGKEDKVETPELTPFAKKISNELSEPDVDEIKNIIESTKKGSSFMPKPGGAAPPGLCSPRHHVTSARRCTTAGVPMGRISSQTVAPEGGGSSVRTKRPSRLRL